MKTLIIANWKSNPQTAKDAVALALAVDFGIQKYKKVDVVVASPFLFISQVKDVLKSSKLGAQNSFWSGGAYTGEVSPEQLKNIGVEYCIVGHSERRGYLGETDGEINKKVKALLKNKLKVILCVGEKERVGKDIPEIVGEQLKKSLDGVKSSEVLNLIVAYEPVWAISTNPGARPDTPANAFQAMLYIRRILTDIYGKPTAVKIKIIYGGSVNSQNISGFLKEGRMEGALVGGASLKAEEFVEVVKIANQTNQE
ncbi:MAG: triose-phosphate isomerase [bacterium]|nr:triose-phosphate isomerase [bacterium]